VLRNVFSTELGIRLSFVKTSEFRGGGFEPPKSPLGTPLLRASTSWNPLRLPRPVMGLLYLFLPLHSRCRLGIDTWCVANLAGTEVNMAERKQWVIFSIWNDKLQRLKWNNRIYCADALEVLADPAGLTCSLRVTRQAWKTSNLLNTVITQQDPNTDVILKSSNWRKRLFRKQKCYIYVISLLQVGGQVTIVIMLIWTCPLAVWPNGGDTQLSSGLKSKSLEI
jgi:hypothetical protein